MTDAESPAARRHRIARAVRAASTLDAAAQLLTELHPDATAAVDELDAVDVPWELAEIESLSDWTYDTLLKFAIDRRSAPSCIQDGLTKTMRASDLLASRKYELVGLLALASEQAWALGDGAACHAMAQLCELALTRTIGGAALTAAFGADDAPGEG